MNRTKTFIVLIALTQTFSVINLFAESSEISSELRFFRNEIFARHGRTFNSNDLKNYFQSKTWYQENPYYNDSLLTQRELLAIETISELEKEVENISSREKKIINEVLQVIKKFFNSEIDTAFFTLGNFDGNRDADTIKTEIKENGNTIIIRYSFLRDGRPIWTHTFQNPYLWINDSNIFEYGNNPFIIGYTAI